jgi:hypothetical protein
LKTWLLGAAAERDNDVVRLKFIISSLVSEYHIHKTSLPARPFRPFCRSAFRRSQIATNPAAMNVAIRSLTAA